MFEYLFAFSSSRFIYFGLIGLVYVLFPRFAVWKIASQRVVTMNIHWNLAVSMEMDVVIEVKNPNFVGAHIDKANLEVYRVPLIHVACEDARENDYYNLSNQDESSIDDDKSSTIFSKSREEPDDLSFLPKELKEKENIIYQIMRKFQSQDTCVQYPNSIEDIYAYYQSKKSSTSFEQFHDQVLYRYHHNHHKRNNHLSRFWTRDTNERVSRKENKRRKQKIKNKIKNKNSRKKSQGVYRNKNKERKTLISSNPGLSYHALPTSSGTVLNDDNQSKLPCKDKASILSQEHHSETFLSGVNSCDFDGVLTKGDLQSVKTKELHSLNKIRTDSHNPKDNSFVDRAKMKIVKKEDTLHSKKDTSIGKQENGNLKEKNRVASILVKEPVDVPKRSHFFIKSRVSMDHLPFFEVISLLHEIFMNKGVLRAEISGLAYIKAVGINLELIMDCLQVSR